MALTITDMAGGNIIEISDAVRAAAQGEIILRGSGNHISIGGTPRSLNLYSRLGQNCRFHIGSNINCQGLSTFQAHDSELQIGNDLTCNGKIELYLHEPSDLRIGNDCLFAGGVRITTSDMHSIIDLGSGERVNPAKDILLGDHVWVGLNALILKGSCIGSGAAIGAAAVVSGAIPAHSVAAGNPARVVRTGVTWKHELL